VFLICSKIGMPLNTSFQPGHHGRSDRHHGENQPGQRRPRRNATASGSASTVPASQPCPSGFNIALALQDPLVLFIGPIDRIGRDHDAVGAAIGRRHRDAAEGIDPFAQNAAAAEAVADLRQERDAVAQHSSNCWRILALSDSAISSAAMAIIS